MVYAFIHAIDWLILMECGSFLLENLMIWICVGLGYNLCHLYFLHSFLMSIIFFEFIVIFSDFKNLHCVSFLYVTSIISFNLFSFSASSEFSIVSEVFPTFLLCLLYFSLGFIPLLDILIPIFSFSGLPVFLSGFLIFALHFSYISQFYFLVFCFLKFHLLPTPPPFWYLYPLILSMLAYNISCLPLVLVGQFLISPLFSFWFRVVFY